MSINWNNIRPLQNSLNDGFEELVCQLARKEQPANARRFVRKGKPDAGIECFWALRSGKEHAWQAKYFTASLTATQWAEIDSSVATALQKHPNLERYIIAIPYDPADARLPGKESMLDKWNARVKKWQAAAKTKGMKVAFEAWWSSDLITRLQKPENGGLTYFWFNKEEFTDEWCLEQNSFAITDLGNRYTKELNVELDISKIFNGAGRDSSFKNELTKVADDFFITGKKILVSGKEVEKIIAVISKHIEEVFEIIRGINYQGIDKIPYEDINTSLEKILAETIKLRDFYSKKDEKDSKSKSTKLKTVDYGYARYTVSTFESSIHSFQSFIENTACKLSNKPFLLLNGEAGIGKSHLLADVVSRRDKLKEGTLFLLGQYFVTDEDPWTQIFKKLGVKCTIDQFLGALNAKAEANKTRFIIFIDALNEGRGKYFWASNIKTFVQKIQKYPWLGLVVSVRATYKKLIFPAELKHQDFLIEYPHRGFRDIEFEASKIFFESYKIAPPDMPLLHPEFQNPLFLKLFCEGLKKSGYKRVPDGLQGITTIINFFIESVNKALSKPNKFDYPEDVNIVKKVVDALIQEKINNDVRYVEYEKAVVIANNIISPYSSKRGFLDELIFEGVLAKNAYWPSDTTHEEAVSLSYERFEDHLTVMYLLNKETDVDKAFTPGGVLHTLVKDRHACLLNQGLIEALSIQLPERTKKELYDYAPHVKKEYPVVEAFVNSLLWRKTDTISNHVLDYLNEVVLKTRGTHELFWDTLLAVATIPNHFFNASALHEHLMKKSLSERDAWWTQYLKYQYEDNTSVKRLIDWGWSAQDKSHISDESIMLSCITLSWFFTSTNRKLRDYATKGLINILRERTHLIIDLLERFKGVNDPYVYERLFAVAYGSVIWVKDKKDLPKLSQYIFETIFKAKGEVYPHILLRDYARGIIEYAAYLGLKLNFDIARVRPPYKSSFPKNAPTDKTIVTKYEVKYNSKGYESYHAGQSAILSSMATEYGKRAGGYGDFGRYTFESSFRYWNVDTNKLSNVAIKWIFEKYGYDSKKHGEFDRGIGTGRGRSTYPNERIGKKYQWIALYELLARVADNFTMYSSMSYHRKDKDVEPYNGPWSPYVRDIDPTTLITNTARNDDEIVSDYWWEKERHENWEQANKDWITNANDLPKAENLISVVDAAGEEWLVLEAYPEWGSPKQLGEDRWGVPRKLMWYQIRSYLVPDKNYQKLIKWSANQDFMGRWMPESTDRYEIFSREYYWSPAYEDFKNPYHDGLTWRDISDKKTGKRISEAMVSSDSYMWEEENDASKEQAIRILKPCNHIFHSMGLKYSDKEGEFIDNTGNVLCFEASVYHRCKQSLLIKKVPFIKYLEENKLKILWTIIGEKNIIGGNHREWLGRLEVSGAYYLKDNNVQGTYRTRNE